MANIKSAIKRAKTNDERNLRNRMIKSSMKTSLKNFDSAVAAGNAATIESSYTNTVSTVDKAAAKGVIHKNAANHKKAQMATKLASAK
ncbi:30S ribosomal protein S20 [bioreactor metagenome]|uniref:30S ribosomal protein S20 n=1 Tax=bioreactor metagenome TaxID=1076179 RepID=A0A645EYX3_9ZZZZ